MVPFDAQRTYIRQRVVDLGHFSPNDIRVLARSLPFILGIARTPPADTFGFPPTGILSKWIVGKDNRPSMDKQKMCGSSILEREAMRFVGGQ
ncbi:hypothetical protein PENSPDRAFT_756686 [Peniophora sp. CONT]|nr:hypothetical protein PENSPDRAFT_756686 [Peniophora sp. CONT]